MSKHEGLAVLDAALTYIKYHPDEWNQATWHCGSSACLAGHVATTVAGGTWHSAQFDTYAVKYDPRWDDVSEANYYRTYGVSVDDRARSILGDAFVPGMFDPDNEWEDLLEYREEAKAQVKGKKNRNHDNPWDDTSW